MTQPNIFCECSLKLYNNFVEFVIAVNFIFLKLKTVWSFNCVYVLWRLLYLCSEVTLSSKDGENLRRQYRTTQARNILRN